MSIQRQLLVVVFCSFLFASAGAQVSSLPKDKPDVDDLCNRLRNGLLAHTAVDSLLSPELSAEKREKAAVLAGRDYRFFEITDREQNILVESDHAKLNATVHWKTANSDFEQTVTLHFVKVNGQWYFADFGFLQFDWMGALAISSVGLAFGVLAFLAVRRYRRKQKARAQAKP